MRNCLAERVCSDAKQDNVSVAETDLEMEFLEKLLLDAWHFVSRETKCELLACQ